MRRLRDSESLQMVHHYAEAVDFDDGMNAYRNRSGDRGLEEDVDALRDYDPWA